jgi:Lrp/AsnC family leucine-responsive transcriptional regulator
MVVLDEQDQAIIDVLKKNARLSIRGVARKSGVPAATVYSRIKKMESRGIIEGYTVLLNQEKLGKETMAYVLIKTLPKADYTSMMHDMAAHEEVEDIGAVSGEFDIVLKVRTSSIKSLDRFVFTYLKKFPDVSQTQTLIVFSGWK